MRERILPAGPGSGAGIVLADTGVLRMLCTSRRRNEPNAGQRSGIIG
jgi:hypothetical protein